MNQSKPNRPFLKTLVVVIASLTTIGAGIFKLFDSKNQDPDYLPPNNEINNVFNPTINVGTNVDEKIEELKKEISELKEFNQKNLDQISSPVTQEQDQKLNNVDPDVLISGSIYRIEIVDSGLVMRYRPLTQSEIEEKNRCQKLGIVSNWLKKIDEETYLGTIYRGEKVTYYRTEGRWHLIEQVSTGTVAYISGFYANSSTLR
ncbi:MAG: hypothetical protein IPG18_17130 [Saprospiraceae bacterium]|nr:hypothetical protein [Saprospiraceae bacterium]